MSHAPLTRRQVVRFVAAMPALALLSACGTSAASSPTSAPSGAAPTAAAGAPVAQPTVAPIATIAVTATPATGAATAPTTAPAAAAAPTTAANLKGSKLEIIAGNFYVPENNTQTDDLAKQVADATGMQVKIDRFAGNEGTTKIASIIESGTGGDLAVIADTDPYLYNEKLTDFTDVADEISKAWNGWYDIAKQSCVVNGKWRALMLGQAPAAWNYRTDLFQKAGIASFPTTFDELLAAGKTMKQTGVWMGMTLGHAGGDGRSTNYPVLWAFGGKEFAEDGKTVTLNSPETVAACEWYAKMYPNMDPAVLAWLDPDNNQAFLASKCSATVNVNTIYLAAKKDAAKDPNLKMISENMAFGNWPSGPAGRFGQYNINHWAGFASSKNRDGQVAFMRAWFDKKFLVPWTKTGQSYFIPPLKDIETADAWPDDPKLQIFRELNKINRLPGWPGPPTHAVAQMISKFVLVDMFAKAATGQMKPAEAVKWAEDQYKQAAQS